MSNTDRHTILDDIDREQNKVKQMLGAAFILPTILVATCQYSLFPPYLWTAVCPFS